MRHYVAMVLIVACNGLNGLTRLGTARLGHVMACLSMALHGAARLGHSMPLMARAYRPLGASFQ